MNAETFLNQIEMPFELDQIKSIESNAGSTWIALHDGTTYSVMFLECSDNEIEASTD